MKTQIIKTSYTARLSQANTKNVATDTVFDKLLQQKTVHNKTDSSLGSFLQVLEYYIFDEKLFNFNSLDEYLAIKTQMLVLRLVDCMGRLHNKRLTITLRLNSGLALFVCITKVALTPC